jgi:hypothetical protein
MLTRIVLIAVLTLAPPTTRRSRDGALEVTLPDGWSAWEQGTELYDLYLTGPGGKSFLYCVSELKEDFVGDPLQTFAQQQIQWATNTVQDGQAEEPQTVQLDGRDVIRCKVTGHQQGRKTVVLVSVMETETRVVSWCANTTPSRLPQIMRQVDAIISSTREVQDK